MRRLAALALVGLLAGCSGGGASSAPTAAPTAAPSPTEAPEAVVWVCPPDDEAPVCTADLDAVAVTAAGTTPDPFEPLVDPPVDCFYVYPTVSQASGDNALEQPEPAVVASVRAQAALLGEACRVVAPVYRQVTVAALLAGRYTDPAAQQLAFDDVAEAWRAYLGATEPDRGVVLVGHSQGGMQLARLLAEEPAGRDRVVSALLVGAQVSTPEGSDVADQAGGLPACREPGQVRCVVAYSAFSDVPPPGALFGRAAPGRTPLCTDPTRLSGGDGTLHPYVPTDLLSPGGLARAVPAPEGTGASFVAYPGGGTAECRTQDGASWLHVAPVPGAPAPPALARGDGGLGPDWGLHSVDVTLTLGDLVEVVRRQAETWADEPR